MSDIQNISRVKPGWMIGLHASTG